MLHGLVVLIAFQLWAQERTVALLLSVGLLVKVVWEQVNGTDPGLASRLGGEVVVDAHLYGLASGVLAVVVVVAIRRVSLGLFKSPSRVYTGGTASEKIVRRKL